MPARHAAIVVGMLAALSSASAQEGPVGIAFVEAPEMSSGVCTAGNPDRGFACARQKCAETEGARESDCLRVAWCYPSGWSVDVFMQHREGPHWHEYSCGWPNREAALKAAEIRCDPASREYLIECAAVRVWDPEGTEMQIQ